MTLHISNLSLSEFLKNRHSNPEKQEKEHFTGDQGSAYWRPSPSTLGVKAQHAGDQGSTNGSTGRRKKTVVRAKETYLYIYENPLAPSLPERQKENKGTYMSV